MAQGAVADEEESGFGVVAAQDVEELRREGRMWAVIERKRHKRKAGADAVDDVGREALEDGKEEKGLGPEDKEREQRESAQYQ